MSSTEEIHSLQMRKSGRSDFALVWLVGTIRYQVHAEFPFRRLNRGIHLSGRDVKALGIQLKMVDKRFHRPLHVAATGRRNLVVQHGDWTSTFLGPKLLQALLHDLN